MKKSRTIEPSSLPCFRLRDINIRGRGLPKILLGILAGLILVLSSAETEARSTPITIPTDIVSGDLIFLDLRCGICEAIETVTQIQYRQRFNIEIPRISHIGILSQNADGSFDVIESLPKKGVIRTPLVEFLTRVDKGENERDGYRIGRFKEEYREAANTAAKNAVTWLGTGYDDTFRDLNRPYCSALVWQLYKNGDSNAPLFDLLPMYFGEPGSTERKVWEDYCRNLGIEVPVGLPGISPGGVYGQAMRAGYFK